MEKMIRYLCIAAIVVALSAASAAAPIPDPPLLVRLEGPAWATLPGGGVIALPAGTEIPACGAKPIAYAPSARTVHVVSPCVHIFRSGFE